MDDDDFTSRMNSFSISTHEEKLTRQLDTTHITSDSNIPSIFATNTLNSNLSASNDTQPAQPSIFSLGGTGGAFKNANTIQSADNNNTWDGQSEWANQQGAEGTDAAEEGWGEAPAATAVQSDTLFGFNSIMETPEFVRKAQLANTATYDKNCHAAQTAFQQYKNRPVSFTSAAAEVANKNSHFQQQHQHHHP